jgi:hypothetical protein
MQAVICTYFFHISWVIHLGIKLLAHVVRLTDFHLVRNLQIVAVPFCIPTSNEHGFLLLHTFANTQCGQISFGFEPLY